jgi:hypothetical protein
MPNTIVIDDSRLACLIACDCLMMPYIWGGDSPEDGGMDCSGFFGHALKTVGRLPPDFDTTAQGYFDRYKQYAVIEPYRGCGAFYGKNGHSITHVMLIVSPRACIGAVRGNKWTTTPDRAARRNARIDVRPIHYRNDLVLIADPFKGEPYERP